MINISLENPSPLYLRTVLGRPTLASYVHLRLRKTIHRTRKKKKKMTPPKHCIWGPRKKTWLYICPPTISNGPSNLDQT